MIEGSSAIATFSGDGASVGYWNLTLYNSTAIPEPATWAMLMLGFASLGFAGYRASRNSAVAA